MKHSDFIVYVDESGDHSLSSINPRYPLFVLALCVLKKKAYTHEVAPALRHLKFTTFGHDMVVLHESEIRKRLGAFAGMAREQCESFMAQLTELIDQANFHVIATVIDKRRLDATHRPLPHAYHVALGTSLEALFQLLRQCDQDGCVTHLVCEARGAKEDAELSLEFERLCNVGRYAQRGIEFQLVIADKKTNSEGLQLADLVARPIGLSVLRPGQSNRAVDIIKRKLATSGQDAEESCLRLLA